VGGVEEISPFCKSKRNWIKSLKWRTSGSCISFWGWRWKGIVMKDFYVSTKSNTSRKYWSGFEWRNVSPVRNSIRF
jgi:hypothetical protein